MKARREMVSWFAILLLAVNILASGTLPAHPISSFSNVSTELLASAMEICAKHGPVQQSSDLPGEHDDHGLHCVFCLPLMHGGLALPDTVATIEKPVETKGSFAFASERQQIIPVRFRSIAAPRAPPLA
jgi:hypothetical protein